ncbi:hypothetical protein Q3G72_029768 [Acer saccharum]|nr:hypothetical protein Q3G72_029768 [Acer saccharum]
MGFVAEVTEFAVSVAGENLAAVAAEELDGARRMSDHHFFNSLCCGFGSDTHSMAQLQWRRLGAVGEIGGGGLRRKSYPGDAVADEAVDGERRRISILLHC